MISERSDDSLSVSCLIFDEKPHYWFEYQAHKLHMTGDYHLGYFEFCPIWIDSVRVKNAIREKGIEDLEEIDAELFDCCRTMLNKNGCLCFWFSSNQDVFQDGSLKEIKLYKSGEIERKIAVYQF